MEQNLKGVRALVTGGASGIGKAIAKRLCKAGARVAITDVKSDRLNETVEGIRLDGGDCMGISSDVSNQADVDRLVKDVVAVYGGLDVLVNNAGVSGASFIENTPDSEIERILKVNLVGVMRVTRAAAKYLKESGRGRIINLSSVEGIRGSGLLPVYSASKAGVIGLTRANAIEFARFKCTVNALCPGPIQTEMLAPLIADAKAKERFIKGIPMRRLGVPDDVAGVVAFLASEESSFITANTIVIDGGMTCKSL
jgi:NAD(P)-dependent dehydrogenase (short-subunit alcohol dehydrogenase family)